VRDHSDFSQTGCRTRAYGAGSDQSLIISTYKTQHSGKEHQSLKMKCTAAPFFGSDIGDGLRKVPAVAVKVLSVVLALAIGFA
jgi:hypothetical protein